MLNVEATTSRGQARPKFHGIIPPLATPLIDPDSLDRDGLGRLVDHVLDGGVHGLFLLGTTGEGSSLSGAIREELVERVIDRAAGRVPIYVCVTSTSYADTRALSRHAARCGADALVLAPPCYFSVSATELRDYARRAADELPLPLLLYNIPSCTKICFDLETVRDLLDHPNIYGLKDSAGDMTLFHREALAFEDHPGKSLLMGSEELLADALLLGGHGGVCGGANLFPRIYVDLYDAVLINDMAAIRELHRRITKISASLYTIARQGPSALKGIKCALAHMGLCREVFAEPLRPFGVRERERVASAMRQLGEMAHA